jgi:hypothetical protein
MRAVKIELLYLVGCPGWHLARPRLRQALRAVPDAMAPVTCRTAGGPGEAGRPGFRRPPAILAGGRDPVSRAGDLLGLACRRYPSPGGGDQSLTGRQIQAVPADAA